ncbi:MAG: PadR family transcriptional regulator [Caulobacteraceae bacterium]|nr:PadR family transcriptional regulator [Caulobacteraceae bacterium]
MFRHHHHHHHHPHARFGPREFGFGGRGFGGRGHGHGPGRRGRFFDQGDLRFVILQLISEKPAHGYEIIKEIEERLGGAYAPSPGVVYPTLTLLEELGYVTAEADGAKKLYTITEAGRQALRDNQPSIDAIFERIRDISARFGGGVSMPIMRARENLKTALRLRLSRGPLTDEQIVAIAAALDAAAKAVEEA